MRKPEIIKHNGKEIIYLNFSNLKKKDQVIDLEVAGGELIQQQKFNSALVLTNMENMFFNNEIRTVFIKIAKENTPHIKGAAVIGLYGIISVMYKGFLAATGRNIKLFKTKEEALVYLTSF